MKTSAATRQRLQALLNSHDGMFHTLSVSREDVVSLLADAAACDTLERENERLKAQVEQFRMALDEIRGYQGTDVAWLRYVAADAIRAVARTPAPPAQEGQ